MKTIRVKVTNRDIENGKRGVMSCCPVALALRRLGFECAMVGEHIYSVGKKTLSMPKNVHSFVRRFDDQKPVKPFAFTLKIP